MKIKIAKSFFFFLFFKKDLKYTYQQRDASNGYCEVLNMNLNIWFDIPSKYIENFFVILYVAVGIFSDILKTHLVRIFPFDFFLYFSSYG